jgi:hypothetical protein
MARAERKALIERIEQMRGTRVITYVTGDRHPWGAQIGNDAIRPLYAHLRQLQSVQALDLFIYSRGGDIDVPWRIATGLRGTAVEWTALVPFRANSAATLLALGADEIVMGPQAELGPIDPIMNIRRPAGPGQPGMVDESVNVEDVMSYIRFISDRVNLTEQDAIAASLGKLTDRLDAIGIGNAYRTHSHIREVARRMLGSRTQPADAETTASIIETLAEKVYAHGHAIGRQEAAALGLPVLEAPDELDAAMWELLEEYEQLMGLSDPVDPIEKVRSDDEWREDGVIAAIESSWGIHEHRGAFEVRAQRQMPASLQVTVNLPLNFPPGLDPATLPQQVQQLLNQMLQATQQNLVTAAQQAVNDALKAQAPLLGADVAFRGGSWRLSN